MYLDLKVAANYNSATPHPYSQWLNPVNYWLINHCTGWTRTGVTSFGRQFDFNDVTYHIGHCNVDTRRGNVVFTTSVRSKRVFYSRWILIDSEGFVHILYPLFF